MSAAVLGLARADAHPARPDTGEPLGRDRRRVVADNTVFHERGRESRIVLPIIPLDPSRH